MAQGRYTEMRFRLKSKSIRSGRFRPTNKPLAPDTVPQTARRPRAERAERIERVCVGSDYDYDYETEE